MKIEVTEADILAGLTRECEECPIALAARRAGLRDVSVNANDVSFRYPTAKSPIRHALLPREAAVFVRKFDGYRAVEPFAFDLEVP